MLLQDWLLIIERSTLTQAIAGVPGAVAALSALHAVAFTALMGSAVLGNLRACNVLFVDAALRTVMQPATRAMRWAASVSALTGLALVAPRAAAASQNIAFIVKILCVVAAILLQWRLSVLVRRGAPAGSIRRAGALAGSCWFAAAVAACVFILAE